MDIALINKEVDLAGLSVYGNRVTSGLRYMKMRQLCIDSGVDVQEKDHFYRYAEFIVNGLAAGTDQREIKTSCVIGFANDENTAVWQVIGMFESGTGLGAIKRRSELIESLKGSGRGTVAFLVIKSADGDRIDAMISNGFGRVFSSHKAGYHWTEKPSARQCCIALQLSEFNHVNELVTKELNRQCNLDTIKTLGMKPGEVFDGYGDTGSKPRKIKVLEVNAEGAVKFEILAPGIKEKGRIKKEIEARLLKVSKCQTKEAEVEAASEE
ncbi:MAG: hypothetical protein ACTS9Y_01030 [Methylophilus sp.]|uniref:hypothetical protein n=1 Tax=Methylophilus sp. TaxID=29541 RepID=UPI003FA05DFC